MSNKVFSLIILYLMFGSSLFLLTNNKYTILVSQIRNKINKYKSNVFNQTLQYLLNNQIQNLREVNYMYELVQCFNTISKHFHVRIEDMFLQNIIVTPISNYRQYDPKNAVYILINTQLYTKMHVKVFNKIKFKINKVKCKVLLKITQTDQFIIQIKHVDIKLNNSNLILNTVIKLLNIYLIHRKFEKHQLNFKKYLLNTSQYKQYDEQDSSYQNIQDLSQNNTQTLLLSQNIIQSGTFQKDGNSGFKTQQNIKFTNLADSLIDQAISSIKLQ